MVPLHAIDEIYEEDKNFAKIKNFVLKESLGDDIYIDYQKPFLIFKNNNPFGDFLNGVYTVGSYVPIVGTVLSGVNFIEGAVQDNEEQVIEGGVDLVIDALTLGWGKFAKAAKEGQKVVTKTITKGATKKATKKPLKNIVKTFFQKQLKEAFSLKNFLKKDIINDFQKSLKENDFSLQPPIVIDLDNNTKMIVSLKQKPNYPNIKNNDQVIVVNHEGEIVELNE
ncbi:hypothetical protein ['Camptotheca acuminata' phytoplasma]|uniref:hypothetical protein n=1 Tax='Camptotheca acuminata' phytoplasma TaxID=3239192 RepID=UPI00351A4AD2